MIDEQLHKVRPNIKVLSSFLLKTISVFTGNRTIYATWKQDSLELKKVNYKEQPQENFV